jgi:checkpoint serine/threonine-protein kinase
MTPFNDNPGSDLALIDFGRAIDLTAICPPGVDPMDVKLVGDASLEDMRCVAMRRSLPWSFDIDTFGACAAAHVLLFGTHIQIEVNRQKRWIPSKPFKRYHQKELWSLIFDTLLNLEPVTQTAIGSRPRSLKELRNKIDEYLRLENRDTELQAALKHQATLLL